MPPRVVILVSIAALAVSACATGRAANVNREPLAVPTPPPRVIAPVAEPEPAPPPPVSEPEPVPPLPRASKTVPQRTEPKPSEPAAPPDASATSSASPGPPAGAAPSEATELRTVETPDGNRATRQVQDTLGRANATLGRVDYRNLSQPAKLQYDMAKRFMEQSEEALKARNFTAALLMAEKAETIAKELSGR